MRMRVVRGSDGQILAAVAEDPVPQVFLEPESEDGRQQSEAVEATSAVFFDPQNISEAFGEGR
ncbi:hypothetical protein [Arthrobacter mobilis]|uniref:Uncharacterized protein n=1 Tax=Arthrobacter mobilis TaxID=2724944 RepID=A0A7X6HHH6_9MICC|nr:hypothetical protein [Arthrobacter mobilis]NKX55787.1 hypothetical protein [Arthrobacter mobilis]